MNFIGGKEDSMVAACISASSAAAASFWALFFSSHLFLLFAADGADLLGDRSD
jgi:hypothetical protein